MIVSDLIANVRGRVADALGQRFPDVTIARDINNAFKHLHREVMKQGVYLNERSVDVEFTSGTQETEITLDTFVKFIAAQYSDGTPIKIYSQNQCRDTLDVSMYIRRVGPASLSDDQVTTFYAGWYRLPSSTFTVTLWYEQALPLITIINNEIEGSEIHRNYAIFPEEHIDVLILYASLLLLGIQKDSDNFLVGMYQTAFTSMVATIDLQDPSSEEVVDVYY